MSACEGARAPLDLALQPNGSALNGQFYRADTPIAVPSSTHSPELAERLDLFTRRLLG